MTILLIGARMSAFLLCTCRYDHHHPADLDYANNVAGNEYPTYGYALVYPLLLIGKIVFVQMLWQALKAWACKHCIV